ncbi:MAG: hypothetical protein CW716_09245, partial [Candidatus Bathyarchaeum sp.]
TTKFQPEVISRRFKPRKLPAVTLLTTVRGVVTRLFEECGETLYSNFYTGLGNPYLTSKQRSTIEADIDDATPAFEESIETTHFILKWTNSSTHAPDNIADSTIIEDTGDYLETAWTKYNTVFGKAPYVPSGSTKIEVNFLDIAAIGVASPPDGPIQFDSQHWVNTPGLRQPTSAHELFHKLQYAFGYRTTHTPSGDYKWFSEGTASWSEVFVWKRVSGDYKIKGLFENPDLNLYSASYRALPFWIFFETRQQDSPTDNPLISFFQKYESTGDERASAAEVIDEDWPANNVYGQLDHFFALFARDRRLGHWRQTPTGGHPYATILDEDGNNIVPALLVTEISLGSGDSYSNGGSVSQLGSDYYRFNFENNAQGKMLTVSVTGVPGGDYSYYLIWEKNGVWKKASFPFGSTGSYSYTETLDLATANGFMIIISGRGTGGAYTINTSVG